MNGGELLSSSKQLVIMNLQVCNDAINLNKEPKEDIDLDGSSENNHKTIIPVKPTKTVLLPLLRKFIYILKKETGFFKFKSLNENGFSLLNDNSYYPVGLETKTVLLLFFFFFFFKTF